MRAFFLYNIQYSFEENLYQILTSNDIDINSSPNYTLCVQSKDGYVELKQDNDLNH